jgi:dTDP-4-amino-4,6-dideoxygalactose transaminase
LDQKELLATISEVISSGSWIQGPQNKLFEEELADYLQVKHVVGVASGTDALILALRAVGCQPGSKIIAVANAGGYTSIAASIIGCEVLFCDIDEVRLVMDPNYLMEMLSEEITAVVVTHLYGNVAPISRIVSLCQKFGIKVIEDCAQAVGAKESGLSVGTIGDVGAFSFYPTKNLGALGDGGAIVTNNPNLAEKIVSLKQYGWGDTKYSIEISGGSNSRLDEIQAAVLRLELDKLNDRNQRRRNIVSRFEYALSSSNISLVTSHSEDSVCHLAVVLLADSSQREIFIKFMGDGGIQTSIHYPILDIDQPGLGLGHKNAHLPISVTSNLRIVTIPLFPELDDHEVDQICNSLSQFTTNQYLSLQRDSRLG